MVWSAGCRYSIQIIRRRPEFVREQIIHKKAELASEEVFASDELLFEVSYKRLPVRPGSQFLKCLLRLSNFGTSSKANSRPL